MSTTRQTNSAYDDGHPGQLPNITDLQDRLDSLWATYLRHLDAYTTAQKALQQQMRSGFFSLSRANFNARSGIRYGKDYFHDRATATTRAKVEDAEGGKLKLRVKKGLSDETDDYQEEGQEEATQQPSPPATPGPEESETKPTTSSSNLGPKDGSKTQDGTPPSVEKPKLPLEADPLRWYGILIPQELRSAHAAFSSVVDKNTLEAVNAGRAMREVEVDIRRLRKEIRKAEKAAKG